MLNQHAPTVLIVDDSATTRAMIKRVIEMTGLNVGTILQAENGRKGLDILETTPVDLVLADLNMPVMDGMEMIARMHGSATLSSIHVVVISAQPDPEQIEQLKRDGVAGYLAKPFTPEGVSTLIAPLLEAQNIAVPAPANSGSFNVSLAESLVEAMETMAFISPELPDPASLPVASPDMRLIRIDFHGGGISGSLAMSAPAKLGEVVAENCGADDAKSAADDAMKELANVTCGLLLRKHLGHGVGFKMMPPIIGPLADSAKILAGGDVVAISADGHLVTAHVTTNEVILAGAGTR